MSSEKPFEFTKENIDLYLNAVAKEYRKRVGKGMPAELILIGGASVLINYGFRNATTDVDAVIEAASSMKDAINAVGDRMGLPNGWLMQISGRRHPTPPNWQRLPSTIELFPMWCVFAPFRQST